jgi:hypothetical protein
MWYGTATFHMVVHGPGVYLYGGVGLNSKHDKPPSSLRLIRFLKLEITLYWPTGDGSFENLGTPGIKWFLNYLLNGPYKLSALTATQFRLDGSPPVLRDVAKTHIKDEGKKYRAALRWNLSPLTMLSKIPLSIDHVADFWSKNSNFIYVPSADLYQETWRARMLMQRERAWYLEELERSIVFGICKMESAPGDAIKREELDDAKIGELKDRKKGDVENRMRQRGKKWKIGW